MFLTNWLIFKIVAAGVTGAIEYPSAVDFFMNFDSNNSLYFTGGSKNYVSNLILYKGETEYPVYNGTVSNIYISDPATYVSYIQLCNETYVTNTVDVQGVTQVAVYDYSQAQPTQQKIQASDRQAQDEFGYSVSISGDYAIVGAWFEDASGYGNAGGSGLSASWGGAGGGGGAGAVGGTGGGGTSASEFGGPGGVGLKEVTISGTLYNFATVFGGAIYGEVISGESWFAGGGGGGVNMVTIAIGGSGGGGDGGKVNVPATNGTNHTGGGSGGGGVGSGSSGGNGGSGIVIFSGSGATIVVFHYGTFTASDYSSAYSTVSAATTAGHLYSNSPSGTYTWGTLGTPSLTSTNTTYTWTPTTTLTGNLLMVAGGGGTSRDQRGGGGGAGELVFLPNQSISATQQTVVVGNGGTGLNSNTTDANSGEDTSAFGVTANGGGASRTSGGSGGGQGRDQNGTAGAVTGNVNDNAGAVYIFKRDGTTWSEQQKIMAGDRQAQDQFGHSVSISGD